MTTFNSNWTREPRASLQFSNAIETPMSAAAGMVVTEMNTPMRAPVLASTSDTTPTIPARTATTTENAFGLSIRFDTGRTPRAEGLGLQAEGSHDQAEDQGGKNGDQKPDGQRRDAIANAGAMLFVDPERHAGDCPVFGADDHRTDDENLRVGEDADGTDESRDGQ